MIYSEKIPLLPTSQSFSIRPRHFTLIALCAISIVAWFSYSARLPSFSTVPTTSLCPIQPPPLSSTPDWVLDSNFRLLALDRLKGAVRIPTQSYDDMGDPAEDGRFEPMKVLGNYINETFPLLHAALELELVSKFGRLYTWKGSNTALKPIVLMAHQDVVPVNKATEDQWRYPPFSATKDEDGWIWGRGVCDCKNTLIGTLTAVEKLVEEGFKPTRTILLSFGIDEEISGKRSASPLAVLIESRYGPSGVAFIVDEGFTGISTEYGQEFARFGMAEKGALSVKLSVLTPGGHSSVPLRHTGIGYLARLLVELEDNPLGVALEGNPMLSYLDCAADYGAEMSKDLKKRIKDPSKWKALGEQLADEDPTLRAFLGTTQAIDLISGGVKVNALPELATATVNYRIDFHSSVASTFSHITNVLEPLVKQFNLTFSVEGSHPEVTNSVVRLDQVPGSDIEPAPITSASGSAWDFIGGTVRHLWPEAILAPSAMIANTDTKWSWGVSDNIYRFTPARMDLLKNYHTVDERLQVEAHFSSIRFFYKLIRNSEHWDSE